MSMTRSPFSIQQILQRRLVELGLSQQLLQLRVLGLQLLEPPCLRDRHPRVLRLPVIEGGIGDPVLATQLLALRPSLSLLQDGNDLLLGEPLRFHGPLPLGGLYSLAV